jgi:RNA polymerase sigma-70 factor, ECF subfamily
MARTADRLYEQVLVLRCQTGDESAFAELVGRYHPRLACYVRRLVGPDGEPEDILQEMWLAAYPPLPRLREPRALAVWLYRIARNTALAKQRGRRQCAELTEDPPAPDAGGDQAAVTAEDSVRLRAALDRLRPEYKEVLTLRFLEDMSYEEIAAVVGRPVGTVRSRLHHAKLALEGKLRG